MSCLQKIETDCIISNKLYAIRIQILFNIDFHKELFMLYFFCTLAAIIVLDIISPWWWGFIIGVFIIGTRQKRNAIQVFIIGFLAGLIAWLLLTWYYDNIGLLANRIAIMLSLQSDWWLRLCTGFVGGILSGLASLSGFLGKLCIQSE